MSDGSKLLVVAQHVAGHVLHLGPGPATPASTPPSRRSENVNTAPGGRVPVQSTALGHVEACQDIISQGQITSPIVLSRQRTPGNPEIRNRAQHRP